MPEEKVKVTIKRKRKITKKRTVVDSAVRNAASLSDGCNPELVPVQSILITFTFHLPKFPSPALSSIAIATAMTHSSALTNKIFSA